MTALSDDPLLQDAVNVRKLSGLSGASVYLMTRDGRHWFIRKAAGAAVASQRLRGQEAKQRAFAEALAGIVTTPKILATGEHEGRFYFDMEYVRGVDATTYLRRASYQEVAKFADDLSVYVTAASQRPALAASTQPSLFESLYVKLCEVQRAGNFVSQDVLGLLFLGLDLVRQFGQAPPTLCHGDLTLENMVVTEGGALCVIDLLDSPYEHYWQDIAKLHQDLAGGWFLRSEPPVAQCVLDFVSRQLLKTAIKLHPQYLYIHWVLVACTFVRILPYARKQQETKFVTDRVNYFAQLAAQQGSHLPTGKKR